MTPAEREQVESAVLSQVQRIVHTIAESGFSRTERITTEDPAAACCKVARGFTSLSDAALVAVYTAMVEKGYFPPTHTPIAISEEPRDD